MKINYTLYFKTNGAELITYQGIVHDIFTTNTKSNRILMSYSANLSILFVAQYLYDYLIQQNHNDKTFDL